MVRIGNIAARQNELEDRVKKIEKNFVTCDHVKKLIKEEIAEEKEIESKINVMCFSIPESKRSDVRSVRMKIKIFLSIC